MKIIEKTLLGKEITGGLNLPHSVEDMIDMLRLLSENESQTTLSQRGISNLYHNNLYDLAMLALGHIHDENMEWLLSFRVGLIKQIDTLSPEGYAFGFKRGTNAIGFWKQHQLGK